MFKSIRVGSGAIKGALLVTGMFSDSIVATSTRRNDGRGRSGEGKRAGEGGGAGSNMPGFKGELGETFLHPNGDIALGLGVRDELKIDSLRTAGARLIKRLDRAAPVAANLAILDDKAARQWGAEDGARALAEGMALANWRVDFFAGKATKIKPPHAALTLGSAEASFRGGLQSGLARGESVNYARQVAATPPNICNPQWMIAEARRLAKSTGLTLRVIDYAQARKLGMGGLVNVGLGSASKPCLIILEHQPKKISPKARGTRLALVGKTITYDTGGYSLKISNGMKGMKYDKCGGMAVLGAMRHIASSNLPVHVYGVLPCAENMVSDVAYRPDDIITMYNGISVEVTNTDAEGRLVLGDALTYADKDLQATHIVELSTLTGGIVTALGHFCAGVFCNHDKLLGRVEDAADSSGDRVWRMPLWKEHRDFMRSQHADLLNSNASRNAHPIQGAAFLDFFVDEKKPWAHLDIAAMGNVEKDADCFVTGPTGYGVRLLIDLAEGMAG